MNNIPISRNRNPSSTFYKTLWLIIGSIGIIWGVLITATVLGANLIERTTAVTGTIIIIGLMITLTVSLHQNKKTITEK